MNSENPYTSPQQAVHGASPSLLLWTIGAVLRTAFIGGVIGTTLGAILGSFSPGYYRAVFPNGDSSDFDPIAVGIGQGLTQGVFFGSVVGLILVAMFYWFRARLQSPN